MPRLLQKVRTVYHFSNGEIDFQKWFYEETFGSNATWHRFCYDLSDLVIESNSKNKTGAYCKLEYVEYVKYNWWDKFLIAIFKVDPEKLMGNK